MSEPAKRKIASNSRLASDHNRDGHGAKRNKVVSGGKWQSTHQKAKNGTYGGGGKIEPGDSGIWATCIKGKEGRATEELKGLFEEYAERIYGVALDGETREDEDEDIESSIQREVANISQKKGLAQLFMPVYLDVQCVLFFKTTGPIVPVEFVQRICEDAKESSVKRKMRFVNRLTPMTLMGKATERGLKEVATAVLGEHFQLADTEGDENLEKEGTSTYAIRPTIRNHSNLNRDAVIKLIASLIGGKHKVDLTKPDRVIIVEIYQNVCGMCVVGNDWEALKRFNLAELYPQFPMKTAAAATPERVTKDDTNPRELMHIVQQWI